MKFIQPHTETGPVQRSFLFYSSPKSGKTTLALSLAELGPVLYIAAESDGWQDAYENLPEAWKKNVQVAIPESLQDIQNIAADIQNGKNKAVIVDSFTALMNIVENQIKAKGGKHVVAGITNKLSLASFGDLANVMIEFVHALKNSGKHIVLICGEDTERIENAEGVVMRKNPLMTGAKTATMLPYEVRAIGYLRAINGKRELWFEASQQWMAGTNYKALSDARMIESPTFAKIFSLFPKPVSNAAPTKADKKA